jgi:proline iminopeptidase
MNLRGLAGAALAVAAYDQLLRPRLLAWGSTRKERETSFPGDDLMPDGHRSSVMATTIDAPPEDVWPWLVQMGADRAGFYSWDRLDNGGRPSAESIHPEWQDLHEGGRILSVPNGGAWFDVALLRPQRDLVLRAAFTLPKPHNFDPDGPLPRAFSDSTWAFHLRPTTSGGTRLVVTDLSRGRPAPLVELANRVFWHPAHWIMQLRQFGQLRRRAVGLRAQRSAGLYVAAGQRATDAAAPEQHDSARHGHHVAS